MATLDACNPAIRCGGGFLRRWIFHRFGARPSGPANDGRRALRLSRPEFTRPAGIPGSPRVVAAKEQYLLAPAQPTDSVAPKKRKRH